MSAAAESRAAREAAWRAQGSASLAAAVTKMRERTHNETLARAYEEGSAPTQPAAGRSIFPARARVPQGRRGRPRTPESLERRRMLGGSGALPPALRTPYSEGARAVLCIIAGEHKKHGNCDLPLEKIAALAGVSRTTARKALIKAQELKHIKVTERERRLPHGQRLPNLTNLIEIVAPEWVAWLKLGTTRGGGGRTFVPKVRPTKRDSYQIANAESAERPQEAVRGVQAARPDQRHL